MASVETTSSAPIAATRKTRSVRVASHVSAQSAVVWLVGLVVLSTLARFALTYLIPAPWIFADELKYSELAKSFAATGHFAVRDVPGLGVGPLYPVLISPAYALFDNLPHAWIAIRFINSTLMSLSAIPTYLLARRLVSRGWAITAAALVLLVPSLGYAGVVMTENLFLPLFLTTMLAIVAAFERPTVGRQLIAVALVGLGLLTRPQAVSLVPALLTAVVVVVLGDRHAEGRRFLRGLRVYTPTFVALTGGAVLVGAWEAAQGRTLTASFGDAQGVWHLRYSATGIARWFLYELSELDLYVGVLSFAAFVVLATSVFDRSDRTLRVVSAVFVSAAFWLLVTAAAFVSTIANYDVHTPAARISDRYTFYAVPLMVIALVAWAAGRLRRRVRPLVAAAVIAGVLPLVLPYRKLIRNDIIPDALGLLPWSRVDNGLLVTIPSVTAKVAVASLVLGALFVLLRGPRLTRFLPLLVALYLLAVLSAVIGRTHATSAFSAQFIQSNRAWIDQAIGPRSHAVVIYSGRADAHVVWENEFFNRSVGAVYYLREPSWTGLPEQKLVVRDGTLVDESGMPLRARYALVDPWVVLRGRVVARDRTSGMRLYRLDGGVARLGVL
jgi:4-amino-4-deoxy-L-arabinose transferase-like glycosyltransferase